MFNLGWVNTAEWRSHAGLNPLNNSDYAVRDLGISRFRFKGGKTQGFWSKAEHGHFINKGRIRPFRILSDSVDNPYTSILSTDQSCCGC